MVASHFIVYCTIVLGWVATKLSLYITIVCIIIVVLLILLMTNFCLGSIYLHFIRLGLGRLERITSKSCFCIQIKARFHYEREKEHSLFVSLIFFCARFNRRSIKKQRMLFSTLVVETGLNSTYKRCPGMNY